LAFAAPPAKRGSNPFRAASSGREDHDAHGVPDAVDRETVVAPVETELRLVAVLGW